MRVTGCPPSRGRLFSAFFRVSLARHGQAARNADYLAGDEARLLRGEEGDDAGNVIGLADALHRDGAHQGVVDLLAGFALAEEAAQDRRVGRPRADDVDGDALARKLAGEGLGE